VKILLDTNAWSRFARGDKVVLDLLGDAEVVFVSVIMLGELYAGFRGGQRERANRDALRLFVERPTVKLLFATDETAEVFGAIRHSLRAKGKPIPMNDVWIAAHALESGATLVTDDAHFEHVDGLRRWPG